MLKDKLNNNQTKNINGGKGQPQPSDLENIIDYDKIKQNLNNDTDLTGAINSIPESIYFGQYKKDILLQHLASGDNSSIRSSIYDIAKEHKPTALRLIAYYKRKSR